MSVTGPQAAVDLGEFSIKRDKFPAEIVLRDLSLSAVRSTEYLSMQTTDPQAQTRTILDTLNFQVLMVNAETEQLDRAVELMQEAAEVVQVLCLVIHHCVVSAVYSTGGTFSRSSGQTIRAGCLHNDGPLSEPVGNMCNGDLTGQCTGYCLSRMSEQHEGPLRQRDPHGYVRAANPGAATGTVLLCTEHDPTIW